MKNVVRGILFLGLAILHIWMAREEMFISYFTPPVGAFIFAVWVGGFKALSEPFTRPDPNIPGGKFINLTKGAWIIMTIALYGCTLIDRG